MILPLSVAALMLMLAMGFGWYMQRRTGNSGWIDTIWSFAVGTASLAAIALADANAARSLLLAGLIALWSLRLGGHIFRRTGQQSDDPRYAALMAQWGASAPLRLFLFLQIQALSGIVLVLAVLLAARSPAPATSIGTLIFAALAVLAIAGEGLADAQLAAFKRNRTAGGICDSGLWSRSRHPNYFFEWLFWVAICGLAIVPPLHGSALFALAAPVLMYVLLRFGSGVPHVEAYMRRTRPEAFQNYAARVPVFFPRLW